MKMFLVDIAEKVGGKEEEKDEGEGRGEDGVGVKGGGRRVGGGSQDGGRTFTGEHRGCYLNVIR